jgi:hypothetical protein
MLFCQFEVPSGDGKFSDAGTIANDFVDAGNAGDLFYDFCQLQLLLG